MCISTIEKSTRIVLIADAMEYDTEKLSVYDREIDRPHKYYTEQLFKAIKEFHPKVILYTSPFQLLNNINKHTRDLIFPFWFGENSRNRHAIVPAICEAANISYLGGDTYTKIVCNDKKLSKILCRQAGLSTPNSVLISGKEDYFFLEGLKFPCVVKPLFEGTSMGISDRSLVANKEDAMLMADEINQALNQPVLVEEFVAGKEVSICLIGWRDKVRVWEAGERYMEGDNDYFINRLYTYKEKRSNYLPLALKSVKAEISLQIIKSCIKLFHFLDKVEYMRIDGRLNGPLFNVIELTPETHLGDDAEFCGTFITGGEFTYNQIIKLLIENCLERYQNQNANM